MQRPTARALEDIAAEFARPLSEVHEMLNHHVDRLDRKARIKQYVPLLAIKQVKELLRTDWRTAHRFTPHTRAAA